MGLANGRQSVRFPGFIGPSYTLQSVNVDAQRCVNLFPEMNKLGTGKEGEVGFLASTPGLRALLTLDTFPVRGLWRASNGELYAVGGNVLYKISSLWVATSIGTLTTTTGPVSLADNGLQLIVVDGTNGYSWIMASETFAQITDVDFLPADQVTFLDGYFIFNKADSQTFFISELNSVDFDALDIAVSEGSPDNLVGLIGNNQNLYLFGTQSTEVYYNSGNADFPFERIQGAVLSVGCAATFSIAKLLNTVYWVGGDDTGQGIIYRMQGYQPERISTSAIESVIRGLSASNRALIRAWTYQQGGHAFYCVNLPGTDSTWVFDATTGFWHERAYRAAFDLERHRVDCHSLGHGENVGGDYENGKLYALDSSKYTDDGTSIVRLRTSPHMSKGLLRHFHTKFQLDIEVGVGLDGTAQGTDPKVMLQWSDDGGHSWSNEHWRGIGKIGETRTRVIWRRLGSSRDRVYRVMISDPVKVALIGADVEFIQGVV